MPTAIVLRHIAFEDLGLFANAVRRRGYALREVDAGVNADPAELAQADLLAVCGGPIGVYELERYPYIADEITAVAQRLKTGRPTLGICLGAQIMAAALGARVYPGGRKELGWSELTLTPAGCASPLALLDGHAVLHWHGDTFDLPSGSTLLASTTAYAHQAFAVGRHGLALQFHAEADPTRIEQWLIGHTGELAQAGINLQQLRADTHRHGAALQTLAPRLIDQWLSGLAA